MTAHLIVPAEVAFTISVMLCYKIETKSDHTLKIPATHRAKQLQAEETEKSLTMKQQVFKLRRYYCD